MSIYENLFRIPNKPVMRYSVICEGEEEYGIDWLVQFELESEDIDDSFDSNYREEVVIEAPDFDTAHKYAQQYIRTMQLKSDNGNSWKGAKIISIDKQ